eukprot:jgi/Botrbrau1/15936/Bobra.0088s0002.1
MLWRSTSRCQRTVSQMPSLMQHYFLPWTVANSGGHALQAFDEMQTQGHRPDVAAYNMVIGTLMQSGIQSVIRRAVQLFQAAMRQGIIRTMPLGSSEVGVVAFTVGSAVLCTLHWLSELRSRLLLQAQGGGPTPAPECMVLLLLRGKPSRSDVAADVIIAALSPILKAAHVPHLLSAAPQGVRVEVEVNGSSSSRSWLEERDLPNMCSNLLQASSLKVPTESMILEDQTIEKRCSKAFTAVKEFESTHGLGGKLAKLVGGGPPSRGEALATLVSLGRGLGLHEESIHDSIQLMDRLTLLGVPTVHLRSPEILTAIALISAGQGELAERVPSDDLVEEVSGFAADSVKECKAEMMAALHNDSGAISALRIINLYLERLGCDFQDARVVSHLAGEALLMMSEVIFQDEFLDFSPSLVAAAVLVVARRASGAWPFWPSALAILTGKTSSTMIYRSAAPARGFSVIKSVEEGGRECSTNDCKNVKMRESKDEGSYGPYLDSMRRDGSGLSVPVSSWSGQNLLCPPESF